MCCANRGPSPPTAPPLPSAASSPSRLPFPLPLPLPLSLLLPAPVSRLPSSVSLSLSLSFSSSSFSFSFSLTFSISCSGGNSSDCTSPGPGPCRATFLQGAQPPSRCDVAFLVFAFNPTSEAPPQCSSSKYRKCFQIGRRPAHAQEAMWPPTQ